VREYRLRVYKNDSNGVKSISTTYLSRDKDIDSEIGSIIVVGDGNGLGDERIEEIDSDDNSDCSNEPRDYPIP
jgi:hypothetical protein